MLSSLRQGHAIKGAGWSEKARKLRLFLSVEGTAIESQCFWHSRWEEYHGEQQTLAAALLSGAQDSSFGYLEVTKIQWLFLKASTWRLEDMGHLSFPGRSWRMLALCWTWKTNGSEPFFQGLFSSRSQSSQPLGARTVPTGHPSHRSGPGAFRAFNMFISKDSKAFVFDGCSDAEAVRSSLKELF